MEIRMCGAGTRVVLCALVAAVFGTVGVAAATAGAEQSVIPIVNEPALVELDDPCTGVALHGIGRENGVVRITELGDQGYHQRVDVRGVVDLYDDEDDFVGTWIYGLSFGDQFPPDGQGAVHFIVIGPLEYADGHSAIVQIHLHAVFEKGEEVKREFGKATCGG